MAGLTEEERKRIEKNKLEAIARREAAMLAKGNNCALRSKLPSSNQTTIGNTFQSNPQFSTTLPVVINNSSSSASSSNNKTSSSHSNQSNNVENSSTKTTSISSSKSNNKGKAAITAQLFYNREPKVTKVNFTLRSKDRFTVDFPYDKDVIEILKKIPGKLYEPRTQQWHFPLSSYQQCKEALEQKCVVPLPNYIVKKFIQQRAVTIDYKSIDISKLEPTLLACLYPFQKEGVQFGISKNGRCIIADDMGLGKTIQSIAIADYYYSDWPLLVVCPSSMRYQWEEEIRTYIPKIPVTKLFILSKSKEQIHDPLVLITSYDLMSRCEQQLLEMKFGVIIMDESHSMKSLKTNRTRSALKLIDKAKRCILLSGTPALSRPMELYPQMKAIDRGLPSVKEFGLRYCDGKEGRFAMDYSGSSNMEELKVLLEEKFLIRRLKSAVLTQLPSKIRQVVVLDKDSLKIDNKVKSQFVSKLDDEKVKGGDRRSTLLCYYAETAKMKLKAIKNYICQLLETDNKFLVFAHHKVVLNEVCELLEEKQTFFIRVDGAVNSEERKSVCDQFQNEDKFKVAVLSITAASTGLTLTAANLVVFAELFWNPGILTQAEDRVHRIGQQDSVLVQYLIASGTADDYLWPLIKEKLHILNKAGLSKDSFSCERTSVTSTKNQRSILDFFDGIEDDDFDMSQIVDEVEEAQTKRVKLTSPT